MPDRSVSSSHETEHGLNRVVDDFAERQQRGERPDVQDYLHRYPQLAPQLADLLPLLVALEPGTTNESRNSTETNLHRPNNPDGMLDGFSLHSRLRTD